MRRGRRVPHPGGPLHRHGLRYCDIVREQTGAEEIAQNVFIALAKKARFLPSDTCLRAWLHRSAVLEAKNWVRGEIRRKRREEIAGGSMMEQDESLLKNLSSVLDEALLDLQEADRIALLARYVERKNLKEVGEALGVTDDTAQKRVSKALAATIFAAGLSAVPAASGGSIAMIAAKFMSLTKAKTITACLALGVLPVAYEWNAAREARAEHIQLERGFDAQSGLLAKLQTRRAALGHELLAAEIETAEALGEARRLAAFPKEIFPPDEELYRWSDQLDYVRLPKHILASLRLTPPGREQSSGQVIDRAENVSPVLLEGLGLNDRQKTAVQSAFTEFAAHYRAVEQSQTYVTNSMPPGTGFSRRAGSELVTLRTVAFPEKGAELKSQLQAALEQSVGRERARIIIEQQGSSDIRDEFLTFGQYDRWLSAGAQVHGYYGLARAMVSDGIPHDSSVRTVRHADLPDELKPYFPAPQESNE